MGQRIGRSIIRGCETKPNANIWTIAEIGRVTSTNWQREDNGGRQRGWRGALGRSAECHPSQRFCAAFLSYLFPLLGGHASGPCLAAHAAERHGSGVLTVLRGDILD